MPQRVQRKRSKGWRAPADAVYVGRGCGMPWGNPWKAEDALEAGYRDGAKMAVCASAVGWRAIPTLNAQILILAEIGYWRTLAASAARI